MAQIEHRWRQWIAENKMIGTSDSTVLTVLTMNGIQPNVAVEEIKEVAQHPYFQAAGNCVQLWKKLESMMGIYRDLAALSPTAGHIERRETLDGRTFLKDFYSTNTPVLMTGMMKEWKALDRWTPQYLKERLKDGTIEATVDRNSDPNYERNIEQHKKKMPFSEYADKVISAGETNDIYMVANNKNVEKNNLSVLLDDIHLWPDLIDATRTKEQAFFWFGPAGTITPIHHDPLNIVLCQVTGRKWVKMWSPDQTPLLYNYVGVFSEVDVDKPDLKRFPLYEQARPLELMLEPGQVLFIPVGWWHHVRSLDVAISVSMTNFVFPNVFNWANPHLVR